MHTALAFAIPADGRARSGAWGMASGYVLGSVALCLLAVAAGYPGAAALAR